LSGTKTSGNRISKSTASISFAQRAYSMEGPGSMLGLPVEESTGFLSIGELEGVIIAVAWTQRGEDICRIISVRRARDEEKRQYHQTFG
jgi:uncharacterized DUF497 family protein